MPNWCNNYLTIEINDVEKANKFESFLKSLDEANEKQDKIEEGLLSYFLPLPEEESENWYMWHIENWGTKWDVSDVDWERLEENIFSMSFDTAWGPPTALYENVTERDDGYEITAYYHECGMGFVGKFEDGFNEYYEYDFADEDWAEDIPDDLIDYAGLDYEYEYYKECLEEDEEE
jgi:hypothetical protein